MSLWKPLCKLLYYDQRPDCEILVHFMHLSVMLFENPIYMSYKNGNLSFL